MSSWLVDILLVRLLVGWLVGCRLVGWVVVSRQGGVRMCGL